MAPLKTFIAMIKRWHVIAVLTFSIIFMVVGFLTADRAMPTAEILGDALFAFVAVPIIVFALAFLSFAGTSRRYDARQNFPSVLLVISAFIAVGVTGTMLEIPEYPVEIAISGGVILSLLASGMFVLMSSLMWPKIGG